MTEIQIDADNIVEFSINNRNVWVKTAQYETLVKIPKAVRSTIWRYGERAVLHVGTVKVSGPTKEINKLWDSILRTTE